MLYQQLRPHPINLLNIIIILISYVLLYIILWNILKDYQQIKNDSRGNLIPTGQGITIVETDPSSWEYIQSYGHHTSEGSSIFSINTYGFNTVKVPLAKSKMGGRGQIIRQPVQTTPSNQTTHISGPVACYIKSLRSLFTIVMLLASTMKLRS